ncbi:MAG: hypothetical protein SFW67_19010 [Myxococcaceae bacterium]|nr:hypothetical protein [Myxococcaceae bacterium]
MIRSQSGTVGGAAPAFVSGFARLVPAIGTQRADLLLLISSRAGFACPITEAFELRPNEASVDVSISEPTDGGAVVAGTYPIVRNQLNDVVVSAYRAPAVCPANLGDGIPVSGTVTITSLSNGASGTLTGQLQGGEQVSVSFELPFCPIRGIGGRCVP